MSEETPIICKFLDSRGVQLSRAQFWSIEDAALLAMSHAGRRRSAYLTRDGKTLAVYRNGKQVFKL